MIECANNTVEEKQKLYLNKKLAGFENKHMSWRETKVVFKLIIPPLFFYTKFVEEKQKLYLNKLNNVKR